MNLASTQVIQTWLQYILACLLARNQELDDIEKRALYVKIKSLMFVLGVLWTTTIFLDVNDIVLQENERMIWRGVILFYVLFIEMEIGHYYFARVTADKSEEARRSSLRQSIVAVYGELDSIHED